MADRKQPTATSANTKSVNYRYEGSSAQPPQLTFITESTDPGEALTMTGTLNLSVAPTTDGDTESSETPVSGLSLDEAASLTSPDLIRWISYRIEELRSTKTAYASFALQKKREKGATTAEADWHATEMTAGYAESIPLEIQMAMLILEGKLGRPAIPTGSNFPVVHLRDSVPMDTGTSSASGVSVCRSGCTHPRKGGS